MRKQLSQILSYQSKSLPRCNRRNLSENLHLALSPVQVKFEEVEVMMLFQFPLEMKSSDETVTFIWYIDKALRYDDIMIMFKHIQ